MSENVSIPQAMAADAMGVNDQFNLWINDNTFSPQDIKTMAKTTQKITRLLLNIKLNEKTKIYDYIMDAGLNHEHARTIIIIRNKNKKQLFHLALEITVFLETMISAMDHTKCESMLYFTHARFLKNHKDFNIFFKLNKTYYYYNSETHVIFVHNI